MTLKRTAIQQAGHHPGGVKGKFIKRWWQAEGGQAGPGRRDGVDEGYRVSLGQVCNKRCQPGIPWIDAVDVCKYAYSVETQLIKGVVGFRDRTRHIGQGKHGECSV